MKFSLFVSVLAILLGTAAFAQENPDSFKYPHPYFFGLPHFFFRHPKIPAPKEGAAMPPLPAIVDERIKCYEAYHDPDMKACTQDFFSFMKTHKVSVSPDCCSALEKIEDACKPVFKYQNPFFKNLVSQHCH